MNYEEDYYLNFEYAMDNSVVRTFLMLNFDLV